MKKLLLVGTKEAIMRVKMGRERLKERPSNISNNTEWRLQKYDNAVYEGEL